MLRASGKSCIIQAATHPILESPTISRFRTVRIPEFPMASERAPKRVRHSLPAVLMRAGTSKGLFIHRHDLPASEADWAGPLLAAMGSQGCDARQIDGVGGATSTTSKVAVISPSSRVGVDVDYTFVQIAVGQEVVDFSGNCGNMCSGVGPFALQEGLVRAIPGERTLDVKIYNTNTSRVIVDTVQVDSYGSFKEDGDYSIPGVKGTGSEVKVAFVDPAGSMTGVLFPTGRRNETIQVRESDGHCFSVKATMIDAANPFILVDETSLPPYLKTGSKDSTGYLKHMESIRRTGAVLMGLASSTDAAAKVRGTPKLAIVSSPDRSTSKDASDIHVQAFSMGKPHPSLQLTGAACLASAVCVEGTVAHRIAQGDAAKSWQIPSPERTPSPSSDASENVSDLLPSQRTVSISHSSGSIQVECLATSSQSFAVVDRCVVSRTARRLFEGKVYYYQNSA
jgi:2-methylaconitate cis-trans-isomerase PrpF